MGAYTISRRSVARAVVATLAANAMLRISPAEALLFSPLQAEAYGATGDGVTDDTLALRRCLADARRLNRGVALTPNAVYRTGQLDGSGLTITGNNAMLRARNHLVEAVLFASGPMRVRDLRLEQTSTTVTAGEVRAGIWVRVNNTWSQPLVLDTILATRGTHGVRIEGIPDLADPANAPRIGATITNLTSHSTGVAFWMSGARTATIRGARISATRGDAVVIQNTADVTFVDGTVTRPIGHGVVTQYSRGTTIQNSTVSGCGKGGIVVGGGNPERLVATGFIIANNTVNGTGFSGIMCDPTIAGLEGVPVATAGRISNNIVTSSAHHGIVVTCAADLDVNDNHAHRNAQDGIAVSSSGVRLRRNYAGDNRWSGIALYGVGRPRYGAHVVLNNRLPRNPAGVLKQARLGLVAQAEDNVDRDPGLIW